MMTVTDIARHMAVSRPTAYKIIASVGFPKPKQHKPPRWDSDAVRAWCTANRVPQGAAIVGGVLVRS